MVQLWECLNTFFNLDLIQFYVNKIETFANSRCNPETQKRVLGTSMSRSFRAAPGFCPELVVLPRSKCPLPNLVLSLEHSTVFPHTTCQLALISQTQCNRGTNMKHMVPLQVFKILQMQSDKSEKRQPFCLILSP